MYFKKNNIFMRGKNNIAKIILVDKVRFLKMILLNWVNQKLYNLYLIRDIARL